MLSEDSQTDVDRMLAIEEEENAAKRLLGFESDPDEYFPTRKRVRRNMILESDVEESGEESGVEEYDFDRQALAGNIPALVGLALGPDADSDEEDVLPLVTPDDDDDDDEESVADKSEPKPTAQGSRWMFTCFNPTPLKQARLEKWFQAIPPRSAAKTPNARAYIFGRETCPTTGKEHLQGMVIFDCQKKFATLKSFNTKLGPGEAIDWRMCKCLSNKRCSDYCKKGEQSKKEWKKSGCKGDHFGLRADVTQWGDVALFLEDKQGLDMGKRTDVVACRQMILNCQSWADVLSNELHMEYLAAHMQWAREIFMNRPIERMLSFKFYHWEKELMVRFMPYHSRRILWVYSLEGNVGKSTFTRYLVCNHNALLCPNKTAEAAFLYTGQKIVIFDVSRKGMEYFNWDLLEQVKNGLIVNTKYVPMQKVFQHPTIIVFSNNNGDDYLKNLSADRWTRIEITQAQCVTVDYVPPDDIVGAATQPVPAVVPAPVVLPAPVLDEDGIDWNI